MTSGRDGQPHAHRLVRGERLRRGLAGVLLVDDYRAVGVLAADREQGDPRAVQRQLDLMLLADAADGAHRGPPQPHAELVLGVDREVLRDADAAPGAERQVAQVVVLRQVLRRLAGDGRRRDRRAADRQPADLARRRDGALDEQRRHAQGVRDVVEAVGGIVGGQRADVGVDGQQVAHRVAVLGTVHPVQQRAPRVGAPERGRVERRLQPGGEGGVGGPGRARTPDRGHGPAAELLHHLLPQRRMGSDVRRGDLDLVQGKAGGPQPAVVAGHAVALHQRRVVLGSRVALSDTRSAGCPVVLAHRGGGCRPAFPLRPGERTRGPGSLGGSDADQQTAGQPRQHGASREPDSP